MYTVNRKISGGNFWSDKFGVNIFLTSKYPSLGPSLFSHALREKSLVTGLYMYNSRSVHRDLEAPIRLQNYVDVILQIVHAYLEHYSLTM